MKSPAFKIILSLHDRTLKNKSYRGKKNYQAITPRAAEKIKAQTGIDVGGMSHAVESEFFLHTYKNHGNAEKEAARGQIAMTRDDFGLLPLVITCPDGRIVSKTPAGLEAIVYSKRVNGTIYFVEEVRTGKKVLMAVSMWKKRAGTPDDAGNQPFRPNVQSDTSSKNNIRNAGSKGKGKINLKITFEDD